MRRRLTFSLPFTKMNLTRPESYIDKLQQTLAKLKKQVETAEVEPFNNGKKRGRKPKIQSEESKLIFGKKRGRKPKPQSEEPMPVIGKKRGRKPKPQSEEPMPVIGKKRGRKPKPQSEEPMPVIGKKRGRKPKILQEYSPLVTMVEDITGSKRRKARKTKKHADLKIKAEELPKVEMPVTEEIKPVDF